MPSTTVKKRSIAIDGHRTSISLEDEFWTSFKNIAYERDRRISRLITEINGARQNENLSSAIRLFVLRFYRDKLDRDEQLPFTLERLNNSAARS